MAAEKVVTVTLPSGTKVTCREGLAARLGAKQPATPKDPVVRARKASSSRRRSTAKSDDE